MMHFEITGDERKIRNHSTGHFDDGCLCGSGDFHAKKVAIAEPVDCEPCLTLLAAEPSYLKMFARPVADTGWKLHGTVPAKNPGTGEAIHEEVHYKLWTDGHLWRLTVDSEPDDGYGYGNVEAYLKFHATSLDELLPATSIAPTR